MEALAENMSTFMLGVVVPISTMAALAIGCGDNRQATIKRKQPANAKKHGSMSSKKSRSAKDKSGRSAKDKSGRSGKDKSGRVLSSESGLKKSKHGSEIKKGAKKASSKIKEAKDAIKKPVKEMLLDKKKDLSSFVNKGSKPGASKSVSTSGSGKTPSSEHPQKQTSVKVSQSSKPLESSRRYAPVYCAEPSIQIQMQPHQLSYSPTGGLQQVTLRNTDPSAERQAIKVKCSDNGLYRVNPVYAFVEPGKSISLNVYRNSNVVDSDTRVDKLVFLVAPASKEETDPKNAFKDDRVNHPKLVLPLNVAAAPVSSALQKVNEASGLCV